MLYTDIQYRTLCYRAPPMSKNYKESKTTQKVTLITIARNLGTLVVIDPKYLQLDIALDSNKISFLGIKYSYFIAFLCVLYRFKSFGSELESNSTCKHNAQCDIVYMMTHDVPRGAAIRVEWWVTYLTEQREEEFTFSGKQNITVFFIMYLISSSVFKG